MVTTSKPLSLGGNRPGRCAPPQYLTASRTDGHRQSSIRAIPPQMGRPLPSTRDTDRVRADAAERVDRSRSTAQEAWSLNEQTCGRWPG
jgi:hypothetical protein